MGAFSEGPTDTQAQANQFENWSTDVPGTECFRHGRTVAHAVDAYAKGSERPQGHHKQW